MFTPKYLAMKKYSSFFFPFLVIVLLLSSCAPQRFASRKNFRPRGKVDATAPEYTTTARSYMGSTDNGEPSCTKGSEEKIVHTESAPSALTVQNNTAGKTGIITVRENSQQKIRNKIKRNATTLKVTETNRSGVWLAYGIASLVLGVLGVAMIPLAIFVHPIIFAIIGVAMCILAIIFGIMGLKGKRMRYLAIIGLILGAGGLIGWIIIIILMATGGL